MDSGLWLPVSAGLQGLGQPQPRVPMEQEQDCWDDSVVSAGAHPGALCPPGAEETGGDNPSFSPCVWGAPAIPAAGDRTVNGQTDRHPVPLWAVAISQTNTCSSQAGLSISSAPQCPSQFPALLLIGAT